MPLPKSFTTVTPLSKFLALLLFILLPLFSFYYGMQYGLTISRQYAQSLQSRDSKPTPQPDSCNDQPRECPDGSFVFPQMPGCIYEACPTVKKGTTPTDEDLKNAKTKEDQITLQISQKSGISQKDLVITYKSNDAQSLYTGGTYRSKKQAGGGYFLATKVTNIWRVTTIGNGIPDCKDVDPYHYPKTMVPACATENNTITAR